MMRRYRRALQLTMAATFGGVMEYETRAQRMKTSIGCCRLPALVCWQPQTGLKPQY